MDYNEKYYNEDRRVGDQCFFRRYRYLYSFECGFSQIVFIGTGYGRFWADPLEWKILPGIVVKQIRRN